MVFKREWNDRKGGAIKYVIGLGPGRCGTTTLAYVLNCQYRACVTHEGGLPLPWYKSEPQMFEMNIGKIINYPGALVGDVALYYLHYIPEILSVMPDVKFVCLQRDYEDTVRSYLQHQKERHVSFSVNKFPAYNSPYLWHYVRPKYNTNDEEEGLRMYLDEYIEKSETFAKQIPEQFRVYKMEDVLNDEGSQREMLEWIGAIDPLILTNRKLNKSYGGRHGKDLHKRY